MRVWLLDEFNDCKSDEERDELAWAPPDVHGILFPENSRPVEDVDEAAEKFAEHLCTHSDGWEWNWPQEFVVHDGSKLWKVSVEREMVPEFRAGDATELVDPATHQAGKIC